MGDRERSEVERGAERFVLRFLARLSQRSPALDGYIAIRHTVPHIGIGEVHWTQPAELEAEVRRIAATEAIEWIAMDDTMESTAWGDAACVVSRLILRFNDGSDLVCRATFVLAVEGDSWRVVHTHLSLPAG